VSAKTSILTGNVLVETVGLGLNISRTPVAGTPPTVQFNVGMSYCDQTYLVDAKGARVKLLTQNENQKHVGFTQDQTTALYLTPMKLADGTDTCFGEILSNLWDAAIVADIANPVASGPMGPGMLRP
jgi:hypothetical protein